MIRELPYLDVGATRFDSFPDQEARAEIALLKQNTAGGSPSAGASEYNRVSVRDYGAVGDGVADDRQAIINAFNAAKTMLPCEVYFPAGTYGISNGITVEMEYGTGGLRVCGAGRDITSIKYLESYDPNQTGNMWYAIRIWPVGMPNTAPTDEGDYLHDIGFTGLTVYDPDPIAHALNTENGDKAKEETHGFDLQYCNRASVTECKFITVGDEAIDICFCNDVVVMNNHLVGSPGAGTGGGAISIGDGSQNVIVSGNTVNGSAADETLGDGTVISKTNFGITVESLLNPVANVVITGNTIANIHGSGVNFTATNAGSKNSNIVISNNIITNCVTGVRGQGSYTREGICIDGNIITDCANYSVRIDGSTGDYGVDGVRICNNTFRNNYGEYAVFVACKSDRSVLIEGCTFENIHHSALFLGGKCVVGSCTFKEIGITDTPRSTLTAAIHKYNGSLVVTGCRLYGIRLLGVKCGIHDANFIENTDIELINKNTGIANSGGDAIAGTETERIIGGHFGGRVRINKNNAVVQGLSITSSAIANDAIIIDAKGVSVTGCHININALNAISEATGADYNLIANNVCNQPIKEKVGANTVVVNNITNSVT